MLEELKTGPIVVGLKQLRKALKEGTAQKVFLARNAEPRLVEPIADQCAEQSVPCEWVETMSELGAACGIDVGAAAAAIVR
jgi:large subunit ribosomal protein L7A